MKLAIIGSRTFTDYELLFDTLQKLDFDISCIISGGAKGADALAKKYAEDNTIQYIEFPADWTQYGKSAGPIRNKQIVDECDIILAFWNGSSKGTLQAINYAKSKNKQTIIVPTTNQ